MISLTRQIVKLFPRQSTRKLGLRGVELGKGISVVTSGAGLGMATIDSLRRREVAVGSFLDLGPRVFGTAQGIEEAIRNVLTLEPSGVFFNFFLQVASCKVLAEAIYSQVKNWKNGFVVVRLRGRDLKEATKVLSTLPRVFVTSSFTEACDHLGILWMERSQLGYSS